MKETDAKARILEVGAELFMRYGIKSVTMDDLASELSMSKKTIYQYYKDKDEFVYQVAKCEMDKDYCDMLALKSGTADAIEEIYNISEYIKVVTKKIHPSLLFDLKKYHPRAWEVFRSFKHTQSVKLIEETLQRGMSEGLFRQEIDARVLAIMRMEQITTGFDPDAFSPTQFDIPTVQMQIFDHFVHGIATPKGLDLLQNYQANRNGQLKTHSTRYEFKQ